MFRNYFKIALRNIKKRKVYSFINLIGLVLGLSISIIIMIYVKNELSYDKFHENYENLYRLGIKLDRNSGIRRSSITSPAMGTDLVAEVPEIKDQVVLKPYPGASIQVNNNNFTGNTVVFASESFFNIFSFDLIVGSKDDVLKEPNSIVLSKSLSKKIFGNDNPLGKTMVIHNKFKVTVTGIVENVTQNSHIKYDAVTSFSTLKQIPDFVNNWRGNFSYFTYLLFEKGVEKNQVKPKVTELFDEKLNDRDNESAWRYEPILEPMKDIYLKSNLLYDFSKSGSMTRVWVFSGIAFFILLIATINYMNLSTALSLQRIKEVGIRKVTGATKSKIIYQFLGESLLITLLALVGSMILIEVSLPFFNDLFNRELVVYSKLNLPLLTGIPIFIFLIGILAGSYPAFYISSLKPVSIMQNSLPGKMSNLKIQNTLVLIQFIISIGLIICSLVIYSQLNYIHQKDMGYNKENLVAIRLDNEQCVKKSDVVKKQLVKHTDIKHATVASDFPVNGLTQNGYVPEGKDEYISIHALHVDPDYLETMGMKLVKGRNFRSPPTTDSNKILINQELTKSLNWSDPIGKTITRNRVDYKVIGIVENFHFESFHKPIGPVLFTLKPWKSYLITRINGNNPDKTIDYIEKQWRTITGQNIMNYQVISDLYDRVYKEESQFGQTVLFFTLLAIFLACLGLFGLTAISTTQRTKEIGIRKVLGANFVALNVMLLKQYTKWVALANIVAWPTAYFLMRNWLQNYAYKIDLAITYFIAAGIITLGISIITITYLAVRTARSNPVNSLRYE